MSACFIPEQFPPRVRTIANLLRERSKAFADMVREAEAGARKGPASERWLHLTREIERVQKGTE